MRKSLELKKGEVTEQTSNFGKKGKTMRRI